MIHLPNLLAIVCLMASLALPVSATADGIKVQRGYVGNVYGQMHYVMAGPAEERPTQPALVMIHQTVNSSIESRPLFEDLARDRTIVAIDTPGYGGSDGPTSPPAINDYALAIGQGLRELGYGASKQIDIIGFHTGALIAAEIAIAEPKMVRRAALSGVYFVEEARWLRAMASLPTYKTSTEFFEWVTKNIPRQQANATTRGLPDDVWGRIVAESLRPVVRNEFHHVAAFTYAAQVKDRMPLVKQPVLLLALGDGLRQPTIDSASLFPNAALVDLPQYLDGAYFPDPQPIAAALRQFLGESKVR